MRRQLAHQCFYGPAAGESVRTQRRPEPTAVRPQPNESQPIGEDQQTTSTHRPSDPLLLSGIARQDPLLGQPGGRSLVPDGSVQPSQVGYLGSSSYSAIFDEINGSLDVTETENVPGPVVHVSPVSEDLVRKGADVLFHLRELEVLDRLLQKWLVIGDGYLIFAPIYHTWMREIKKQLGPTLSKVSGPDDLRDMSMMLWHNTRMPIESNGTTTAGTWAQRTAGHRLRWEVLGLLFSAVGIVSGSLNGRDAVFVSPQGSNQDRSAIVRTMLELVNRCIDFCKVCMNNNDLYACLLVSANWRSPTSCICYFCADA